MSRYVPFIALWCLALNTYIVFSSGNVKALENREKKRMENAKKTWSLPIFGAKWAKRTEWQNAEGLGEDREGLRPPVGD